MDSSVYILYTGGTLGMAPNNPHDPCSPLVPQPLQVLFAQLPDLTNTSSSGSETLGLTLNNGNRITLSCASIKPIDSADMTPDHWLIIANISPLYTMITMGL